MKLSVAANYDADLVPRLQPYSVDEVYGKLPWDYIGGGRPSYMGGRLTWRRLSEYVRLLARHGIAFNYLLNAACLGNREWSRSWQKKATRLLEKLHDIGVSRVTVSTPFLLELIKARFPEFKVKVGIYAQVDTARRAKFWEDLGADAITLESFSINRNFARLAAIRVAVRCDLQLIANHVCLPNCALQPYHQNGFAHSSNGSHGLFIDYCFLHCSRTRLDAPSSFIKAQWIRPEDIGAYEKLGYSSFKLLERGIPSEELLKRVKAYSDRRYDGNLADILVPYGFKREPKKPKLWALRNFFRPWHVSPFRFRGVYALARQQGMLFGIENNLIRIDASRIPDDFLDGFRTRDCSQLDCAECKYCEQIAERGVVIDPAFRAESLRRYAGVEQSLVGGGMWDV
jgi:collagenase-like PrtC family protease